MSLNILLVHHLAEVQAIKGASLTVASTLHPDPELLVKTIESFPDILHFIALTGNSAG